MRHSTAACLGLVLAFSVCARADPAAASTEESDAGTGDAPAARPEPDDTLANLLPDIHAFISQGYIKSTGNNYLVNSKHGSFEFNETAVNFTKSLNDRLRMGLQLYAQDLGSQPNNYSVVVDWLYLDYRFKDWLGLRAGRTKLPFGLYNEFSEIDAARVPVLLPQSVYSILGRNYLLAQTGAEVYGYVRLGGIGALDYRLYGGTIYVPTPNAPQGDTLRDFDIPYIYGMRLLWETPVEGLRAGGSVQALRIDESLGAPDGAGGTLVVDYHVPLVLALGSIEYSAHDLLLAAEYGRFRDELQTNIAPTVVNVSERYYGMASYRVASWFTPGAYYSVLVPNIDHRTATNDFQDDLCATLRFDINAHWLVKLEAHYIHGAADVQTSLNGDIPAADLARDWAAFFVKTTAYF